MKIRQYTAATMQEARLKIKMDLGPNAVILHTRSFKKGGLFGLFGKDMVEVLAAVEPPDLGPVIRPTAQASSAPLQETIVPQAPVAEPPAAPVSAPEPPPPPAPSPAPVVALEDVTELKVAVGEVKRMLGAMAEQLDQAPSRGDWGGALGAFYERLLATDLSQPLAKQLVVILQERGVTTPESQDVRDLEPIVTDWIRCSGPIQAATTPEGRPKIVSLIGPTGVGKTTTIAKLAANFRLLQQRQVGLITIDTYRVAAVEQLKTYGDIIGIPVEVVVTPSALKEAIARFSTKDLILIDTAGRSPSNKMHLHELRGFLDFPHSKEVHLVLSATTNRSNLEKIVEVFSPVGVDRLIFTKIDESAAFGGLISIAQGVGLPISYLTTGQSVPDDIRIAESPAIARMLIDELRV